MTKPILKPQAQTMTRKDIAVMMKMNINMLHQATVKPGFNLPAPIGKRNNFKIYNEDEIKAWWKAKQEAAAQDKIDKEIGRNRSDGKVTFSSIIAGKFDRSDVQKRHQYKRLVSRQTKPITYLESVNGDGSYKK